MSTATSNFRIIPPARGGRPQRTSCWRATAKAGGVYERRRRDPNSRRHAGGTSFGDRGGVGGELARGTRQGRGPRNPLVRADARHLGGRRAGGQRRRAGRPAAGEQNAFARRRTAYERSLDRKHR